MEQLKHELLVFSGKSLKKKPTARELKTMANMIVNEALEYHIEEFLSQEYLETMLDDIRKGRC